MFLPCVNIRGGWNGDVFCFVRREHGLSSYQCKCSVSVSDLSSDCSRDDLSGWRDGEVEVEYSEGAWVGEGISTLRPWTVHRTNGNMITGMYTWTRCITVAGVMEGIKEIPVWGEFLRVPGCLVVVWVV